MSNRGNIGNLYTGRAGHLVVMTELLRRGWNTAIPEVDSGVDIFVANDTDDTLRRVQVKTAVAKSLKHKKHEYNALFSVPLQQLRTSIATTTGITYVFAVWISDHWDTFVVINGHIIEKKRQNGMGYESKGKSLLLRLRFKEESITCDHHDLSQYRNDWNTSFPVIEH